LVVCGDIMALRMRTRRVAAMVCGCVAAAAGAQTCAPFFADMGPASYPIYGSAIVSFDDGAGPTLFHGDYYDRILTRWGPTGWQPVSMAGAPPGFEPYAPVVLDQGFGPRLYITGRIGNQSRFLKRVGTQWEDSGICTGNSCPGYDVVGGGLSSVDLGDGPKLYAWANRYVTGHTFVVRWDDTQWTDIGVATNRVVRALVPYDDGTGLALYALGDFSMFSGIHAEGMIKWNGQSWVEAMPATEWIRANRWALAADLGDGPAIYTDAQVYLNGEVQTGVHKWDGQRWTHIGHADQPPPPSAPHYVLGGAVFDDGRGPGLYIGGRFNSFSGIEARNIVRYTPALEFEALGAGIIGEVSHLFSLQDQRGPALYIGGDNLSSAGGGVLRQSGVLWVGCPNCYANCDLSDRSPVLNVNDFVCFLTKFAARDPCANCTNDAVIDVADFSCFLGEFARGCP